MASKLCLMIYMIYETQAEPTDTGGIYWVGIFASPVVFDILIKALRLAQGNVNETCR